MAVSWEWVGTRWGLVVAALACAPPRELPPPASPTPTSARLLATVPWSAPSLEQRMVRHFAVATDAVWYLAADDLGTMRAAVAPLEHATPEGLPAELHPLLAPVRVAAAAWTRAPDRADAARRSAELATACANCHTQAEVRSSLRDDDVDVPDLLPEGEHAVAPYLLWLGLVLPSDRAWLHGTDLLTPPPTLDGNPTQIEAFTALAARARTADGSARAAVWTELVGSCTPCHIASGVHVGGRDRTP